MKKNKLGLITLSLLSLSLIACGNNTDTSKPATDSNTPNVTDTAKPDTDPSTTEGSSYATIPEEDMTGGLVMTLDDTRSYFIVTDYISVEYDIVIPDVYQGLPVREIGEAAFRYKTIDSITLPHSLRKIGKEAFLGLSYDSQIKELDLPEGLEEIDDQAFCYCPTITTVTLPSTLKKLGSGVFHLCANIKKVKTAKGSEHFLAENNVLYSNDKKTLYFYPAGLNFTSYDLPEEVEHISDYAFYGNQVLTAIGIPSNCNLTSIGYRAMAAITNLTTLRLEKAEKLTEVGDLAISENSSLIKVTLPKSLSKLSRGLLYKDGALQSVTIQGDYTEIPDDFLSNCNKLQSFTIPNGVTKIGASAFYSCGNLTKIDLPATVSEIGENAFSACFSLKSFTFPAAVTEVPTKMFTSCRALTTVTLHDGITSIGDNAFEGCSTLTGIDLSMTKITELKENTFMSCGAMTEAKLPETLTVIKDSAFKFCYELRRIQIPSHVTTIGDDAFFNCSKLTYVYLPKSVKSIGTVAFRTVYASEGKVNLYFEADSFVNENTEVGNNFTNGNIFYGKTLSDYETDSQGALL